MAMQLDLVVTHGVFSLDGQDFEVDNNIWLIGDDEEVLVIDAAHHAAPIVDAIAGRRVVCLCCTHGHNDHINAAAARLHAPRPSGCMGARCSGMCLSDAPVDQASDGDVLRVVVASALIHTPGIAGWVLPIGPNATPCSRAHIISRGPGARGHTALRHHRCASDQAFTLPSTRSCTPALYSTSVADESVDRPLCGCPGRRTPSRPGDRRRVVPGEPAVRS